MTNFFFAEDLNIIKNDTVGSILADGTVYSAAISATSCLNLSDEWSTATKQFNAEALISNINVEELYNIDKNFVKNDSNEIVSKYIYDADAGTLTFKDNTLTKYDLLGCPFPGSDEIKLEEIVRDLEALSNFSRISDFGPIYDVKFRQVSFGDYQYFNNYVCSNIAKTMGFLSFDKIINDELARKNYQNELNAKFKGTDKESKFPPYSGFLDAEDYKNGGWVSVDQVIRTYNNDSTAYGDSSLAIRTKRIKDRKRVIVNLLMTYASSIWELNSDNKLVDFGLRIKDRTSGDILDYSNTKNGLSNYVGNTVIANFVGELGPALDTEEAKKISLSDCDEQTSCGKVFVDKCTNTNVKIQCDSETGEEGAVHELDPQFRINPIQDDIDNKPEVLYTVDAIHWTTGVDDLLQKEGIDLTWVNNLIKEFGSNTYKSSFLNENRAFHNVGGTYLDGFAAQGFYNSIFNGYYWGSRKSSELWNGVAWYVGGDTLIGRGLGLGGGSSIFAMTGYGCDPVFSSTYSANEPSISDVTPTSVTLSSAFYIGNTALNSLTWSLVGSMSPIISKHSVSGIIHVDYVNNGTGSDSAGNDFLKANITQLGTCVEACASSVSAINHFVDPENTTTSVTILKNASGICFNGTTGNISFDNVTDIDLDYNFIYFSYSNVQKLKSNKEITIEQAENPTVTPDLFTSLEKVCSYVDNNKRYPIKTVGTCYVGTSTHGVATGGKTAATITSCTNSNGVIESLYDRYFNHSFWNQNNDSTTRYAFEWNNVAWTRVEDLSEDVAYHCGVGDEKWSIFWGGLHGTIELVNIKTTLEDCDDWCSTANIFGGVCHRDAFCSLDGSIRYTDFATEIKDLDGNILYQINNPKDTCKIGASYTSDFTDSLDITWISNGYVYKTSSATVGYGSCPDWTGSCVISGSGFKCVSYSIDTSSPDAYYFDSWESEVYHVGHFKQYTVPISGSTLRVDTFYDGSTVISDPTIFTIASISAGCTYDDSNLDLSTLLAYTHELSGAARNNITNNLTGGYKLHPSNGGMWLWSRPTKGENLYHPENFTPHTSVNSFMSYGTPTSGSIYSFYIDEYKNGLIQAFYGNRKDSFLEKWNNPYKSRLANVNATILWNDTVTQVASLSGFSGTTSVGQFIYPMLTQNISAYNLPEILKEIVDISFTKGTFDISGSNYVAFTDWFYNTQATSGYAIKSYDDNLKWFTENNYMSVAAISGIGGTLVSTISGSSVRDRAALFPWNELINGNVDNHATAGNKTWMWGETGSLYLAECVFADTVTISGAVFIDTLGRTIATSATNYDDSFWREIFRIRQILADGSLRFDYFITYDESNSDDIVVTSPPVFGLFGSNGKYREVDSSRWNVKNLHDMSQTWISGGPEYKTTTSYDWRKESSYITSEAYNFAYRNLCDITKHNFNHSPGTEGAFVTASVSGTLPVWIWSVPYEDDTASTKFCIHKSSLVSDISGYGAEIVKCISGGPQIYVTRAVVAGPLSNGIGYFDIGKCSGITGAPFNYITENKKITHPEYTSTQNTFPWCVIGDNGTHGPTSMVDMADGEGNYWIAFGDSYNKKKSEITESFYTNTYTIARVPASKVTEFNKLVLAKENKRIAVDTLLNYKDAAGLNETGTMATNIASRNREAVIELINTRNGEDIFDLYIKLFDYIADADSLTTYMAQQLAITPVLPIYTLPVSAINGTIDIVQAFVLATNEDNECIECDVCLGEDETLLPAWTEHIHDEWAVRNLESWGNGPFGRENFNAWLAAGCDTRWGVSLWSTLQNGRIWFNYKASDLRVDVSKRIISYAVITSSIKVDDVTNDIYENVPAIVRYDEFHYDMDAYINTPLVVTALEDNKDNVSFCKAPSTIYVSNSMWATCTSGADISGNPLHNVTTENIDPSIGYTEWVTNFVQEYKKDTELQDQNFVEKYYKKYDITWVGANCLIKREELQSQEFVGTSWRRFQDKVGCGGSVPILNLPPVNAQNDFDLTAHNLGQKAFGDPNKAVICGGYSISQNGELQSNNSFWASLTNGPTFKWNRTVINPEDTLNSNYKNRNVSPYYSNGTGTSSNMNLGAIIFDVSKQVNVERMGTATFDGSTTSTTVTFDPIPTYLDNKTTYSIALTANDNIKVWWTEKQESSFVINTEIEGWKGSVDWKITLIADVPVNQIDGPANERKTFDTFEEA